jgi:hypothetical protein
MTIAGLYMIANQIGAYVCTAAEGELGVRGHKVGQIAVIQKFFKGKGTIDLARYRYMGDEVWNLIED